MGLLTTEPKSIKDKEAGNLAETVKTLIKDIWLYDNYGYKEEPITDPMLKGMLAEQDSITLTQKVLGGEFRKKTRINLSNDYITGTPDVVLSNCVEDIKTSFDISTFFNAEINKLYEYQLRGYMELTGLKEARLIYCLVNTPSEIVAEMKKRVWFRFSCDEQNDDYIRISQQIEKNHLFDHIPEEKRIKVFEIKHDREKMDIIYKKIERCREFYKTLSL